LTLGDTGDLNYPSRHVPGRVWFICIHWRDSFIILSF